MPFILLLLLTLACLPDAEARTKPPEWLGSHGCVLLTWLGMVGIVGFVPVLARWSRLNLARDPANRDRLIQRYGSWRLYHLMALLAFYGFALFVLGWGGVIFSKEPLGEKFNFPGLELVVLAPFLAALIGSWVFFYDVEKTLHGADHADGTYWKRSAYLIFHIRQNLGLVMVPVLLLIGIKTLPGYLPAPTQDMEFLLGIPSFAAAILLFLIMPWIVRLVLGLKPMPAGPLRDRFESAARRLKFRCGNIMVWNTRSGVANAMIVGILPFLRYVVFTDRILSDMTPEELEAVFGHEVGHVKHRHMTYYLCFMVASLATIAVMWDGYGFNTTLIDALGYEDRALIPLIGAFAAYIFVIFGYLSRRCERQADIYGCRAVSCLRSDCQGHDETVSLPPLARGFCPTGIGIFVSALEKVAVLNGISRDRPGWLQSWQHSTIAKRVEFLKQSSADPQLERRFQRRLGLLKWVFFLLLVSLILLLGYTHGWSNFFTAPGI